MDGTTFSVDPCSSTTLSLADRFSSTDEYGREMVDAQERETWQAAEKFFGGDNKDNKAVDSCEGETDRQTEGADVRTGSRVVKTVQGRTLAGSKTTRRRDVADEAVEAVGVRVTVKVARQSLGGLKNSDKENARQNEHENHHERKNARRKTGRKRGRAAAAPREPVPAKEEEEDQDRNQDHRDAHQRMLKKDLNADARLLGVKNFGRMDRATLVAAIRSHIPTMSLDQLVTACKSKGLACHPAKTRGLCRILSQHYEKE